MFDFVCEYTFNSPTFRIFYVVVQEKIFNWCLSKYGIFEQFLPFIASVHDDGHRDILCNVCFLFTSLYLFAQKEFIALISM